MCEREKEREIVCVRESVFVCVYVRAHNLAIHDAAVALAEAHAEQCDQAHL